MVIIDSFAGIECMNCNLLVGEEMALKILKNVAAREKYRQFLFNDEVKVTMTWGKLLKELWCCVSGKV